MTHFDALPENLPWREQKAFVLMDGVTLGNLPERIKQLNPAAHIIALYDCPPFTELRDISPLLVAIQNADEAVSRFCLQQARDESAVLLFSARPAHEIAQHLRKMLTVESPEGLTMLLRLADAPVMQALFAGGDQCLFGPLSFVVTADCVTGRWHSHQPRSTERPELAPPYRLSHELNAALDSVDHRRTLLDLDAHLLKYFPEQHGAETLALRWPLLERLTADANALGLVNQSEIFYYANLIAWLDGTAPEQNPRIAHLLHAPSLQPAGERVALAAEHAYRTAIQRERP